MKRLQYYKPVQHVQIGHLYEHIVCAQLAAFFRNKHLYAYTDYNIDARTYYNGYVYIEIELYSKDAIEHEDILKTTSIVFDESTISGCLLQIMAEKFVDVDYFDETIVLNTLQLYATRDWVLNRNEKAISAMSSTVTTTEGLGFVKRRKSGFLTLQHVLKLNTHHTSLSRHDSNAIFAVVAKAIGNNLRDLIPNTSFCFTYKDTFKRRSIFASDTNFYRVDKRQATKLNDERSESLTLLVEMQKHEFVKKLAIFLLNATDESMMMPDEREVKRKTGRTISAAQWRELGTEANILRVIRGVELTFELGKTRQKILLSDVF